MTALETWLQQMVAVIAGNPADDAADPTLAQRVAVALVQARALECRHLAGELLIGGAGNPVALQIAQACTDRSRKLEAIGMQLAQPEGWPLAKTERPKAEQPEGLVIQ